MIKDIKLSLIQIEGTQSRAGLNNDVMNDYAEAMRCGSKFPPVKLFFDGSDYWLADGFHRYFASKTAEIEIINADIENGSKEEAILYSIGSNSTHGLQRTIADKRHAVSMILNHPVWATWSDRAIAKEASVTHPFVAKIRAEIEALKKLSTEAKVTNQSGNVTTTPTPMLEVEQKNDEIEENIKDENENVTEEIYTETDRLKDEITQLKDAYNEATEKLAVGNYEGSENVEEIINNLKSEVKNLNIELLAVKKSRDTLLNENNQLKKQIAMQVKEIKKLSK